MILENLAKHGMALVLDVSLRSLPLLAVAGVALLCLRRASAALRHLVLLLTLAGLLLLPLLSSALPGWRVTLLPHQATVAPLALPPPQMTDAVPPPSAGDGSVPPVPSASPVAPSDSGVLPAAHAGRMSASTPWALYGFVFWLVGGLIVLTPVMAGLVSVWRIERRSFPITGEAVTGLAAELGRELGVRRTVMLRQSGGDDALLMPMTWGWLRHIVLLPSDAADWPTERLRVVLLHELAHIRRGDWFWQMLAHLTCALYWFHPGVWLVARCLRVESERACDDQALSAGVPAPLYAWHLLDIARSLSAAAASLTVALPMAAVPQLEGRVRNILHTGKERKMVTRRNTLTATALALGLVLPLASLRPVSGSQQSPKMPTPVAVQKPFTVVVDAGHGGQDNGAIGADGTREKDINLAIALKLRAALTKAGARVIMTRTDNTFLPVTARPAFAATNHAQYFVSIHCGSNMAVPNSHGAVYYHGTSSAGRLLASDIMPHVLQTAASAFYPVLSDTTRFTKGFGVLRLSPVPAVMVDCGSLTNQHDMKALRQPETQEQIADGIAAGLIEFDAQYPPLRQKTDFVAAVHAHNKRVVQFWASFVEASAAYQRAIRQSKPEMIAGLLSSRYVFNGHILASEAAVKLIQAQMTKYGTRHHQILLTKADMSAGTGRLIVLATERWGTGQEWGIDTFAP